MKHINQSLSTHRIIGVLLGTMLLFTTSCNKHDDYTSAHATDSQEKGAMIASRRMSQELLKNNKLNTSEEMAWLWQKQFVVNKPKPSTQPEKCNKLEGLKNLLQKANPAEVKGIRQQIRNLELKAHSRRQSEPYINKEARKALSRLLKKNAKEIARKHRRSSFLRRIFPSRLFRTKRSTQASDNKNLILTEEHVKAAWEDIQKHHGVADSSGPKLEITTDELGRTFDGSGKPIQLKTGKSFLQMKRDETSQKYPIKATQETSETSRAITFPTQLLLEKLEKNKEQKRKVSDSYKSVGSE